MILKLKYMCALMIAAVSIGSSAQEVTLKVHHFWSPQAVPPSKILQPWCDRIAAESVGRMRCQIFPAMQLGGTPAQLIDQVKDGVVDIAFTLPGYTANRFPIMEVFELPFMVRSAAAGAKASWEFYEKYAQKEFAAVKPLMFSVHDAGNVHTRAKQVKVLADFKGLKLRAPTRMTNRLLASLGATPVAMPLPAVAEAVNKGIVDGFLLPWEVIPSVRAHEMVNYHTETDSTKPALYTALLAVVMNQAKFASLPPDLQGIIERNSGANLSAIAGQVWDDARAPGRVPAEVRGNVFYTVPPDEVDRWIRASSALNADWIAAMEKSGLPGTLMLQDAQSMIQRHQLKSVAPAN